MSNSYQKLRPIKIVDPITDVKEVNAFAVLEGGNQVTFKNYTSTSISNSSINFSCPPPSNSVIVDRKQYLQVPVRLSFTGTLVTNNGGYVPSSTLLNSGGDAPRAFPLSSAIDVLQATINSQSISINMSDVIQPLSRYNIDARLRTRDYSLTPCYPDQSQNYSDLTGTSRNPLGNFGNSSKDDTIERGGFPFTVVSNAAVTPATGGGTAATAVVDMVITEPLFLSPFYWGCEDQQGFYNIINMDFTVNFLANAGFRMWSHNPIVSTSGANQVTSNITSISVQFNGFTGPAFTYPQNQPFMLFKYITPNLLSRERLNANSIVTYPYFDVTRYVTDIGAITYASGPKQFTTNTITLSSIPRRAYVFARPSNSVLQSRCDITDCYLPISNVSIQWANAPTLLATANQQQLYLMNSKNHGDFTWEEFTAAGVYNNALTGTSGSAQYGSSGSPLCFEFGTDIQLQPDEAPGINGQYQIQIQCTLENMNPSTAWDALPMSLYLVVVSEGSFVVTGSGSAVAQLGVLSKMDVLDSQQERGLNYRDLQSINGGDFLSSLRDFGSKVNDILRSTKAVSTIASRIPHPIAKGVGTVAKIFGYGDEDQEEMMGGAHISKKQLRKALEYR